MAISDGTKTFYFTIFPLYLQKGDVINSFVVWSQLC